MDGRALDRQRNFHFCAAILIVLFPQGTGALWRISDPCLL